MLKQLERSFSTMLKLTIPKFCCHYVQNPATIHLAKMMMRAQRRAYLKRAVLNQNKRVLFAEKRQLTDTVLSLKNKGFCAGVINRYGGTIEDQIDIYMLGSMMKKWTKLQNYHLQTIYVRVQGIQYRCILEKVQFGRQGWIQKVYFNEYKVGQPNILTIPIQITHFTQNAYIIRGAQFLPKLTKLKIISYNQDYPTRFYVDISYICPQREYRVSDLANTFPPGILLHPQVDPSKKIATVTYESEQTLTGQDKRLKAIEQATKKQKQQTIQAKLAQKSKEAAKATTTPTDTKK